MYVKTNVLKPTGNAGMGGGLKDKVIVFDWADVASGYLRDDKGVVIAGPLVFNAGTYGIELAVTQNSVKAGSSSEGDVDAEGFIQSVEFSHPGQKQEIQEFISNWLSKNIGIIVIRCDDGSMKMFGAPCAPLRLQSKGELDKDKNISSMTFKSAQRGPIDAIYTGTYTLASVMGTPAANATTVNVAAGPGEYQLTVGTSSAATITTCSNAVDGNVYTLLGSGGTYPSTIAAGADFILRNGTTWTASAGAKLQVKCIKDGASTYKFVEISRV